MDDLLHTVMDQESWWTRSNVGEAIPGVPTPLGWTIWERGGERCTREPFYRIGAASRVERAVPEEPHERVVEIFHGHPSLRLDHMVAMGDRIPGTSGAQVARAILGEQPPGLVSSPTRRRYPLIAARFPLAFARLPGEIRAAEQATGPWWSHEVARVPGLGLDDTLRVFRTAAQRFEHNVVLTSSVLLAVLQPIYEQLGRLAATAGVCDATELAACLGGTPESAVVTALWRASRGELDITDIQQELGYHGPREGELSGRVWREDADPLTAMLPGYAARPDSDSPAELERARQRRQAELRRDLLAATPAVRRPAVRLLLATAAARLPLRGIGKRAFLQSLDTARVAARRAGALLADAGRLDDPEDVFQLSVEELLTTRISKDLVARRKAARAAYQQLDLPGSWHGLPVPVPSGVPTPGPTTSLKGTPVSPGVVEGVARVVTDPAFADVEPGEILVAPTTDPSWASIMFLSAGLVVDIGGALSHAAIVARELGVPCVVNTGEGSRVIRDGDRLRVDGSTGTVEIMDRAASNGVA